MKRYLIFLSNDVPSSTKIAKFEHALYVTPAECMKLGRRGMLGLILKRWDGIYVLCADIKDLSFLFIWKIILALGVFSPAHEKRIVDLRGGERIVHWYDAFSATAYVGLILVYLFYFFIKLYLHLFYLALKKRVNYKPIQNIIYLRTDFLLGIEAGGSFGHTEGVINGFLQKGIDVAVCTTKYFKGIPPTVKQILMTMSSFFRIPELMLPYHTYHFLKKAKHVALECGAVYQRYSLGNFLGVILRRKYGIPLILEYNGSDVWIGQNWGNGLFFLKIFKRIEDLNLHQADVIVVVSQVLKDELISRGIDEQKVIFYPNCVDLKKYNPEISDNGIRDKLNLKGKAVLGFIGTFGQWHGVLVLARAIRPLVDRFGDKIHFLLIGDGLLFEEVKKIIKDAGVEQFVTLTGRVPQAEGPSYLAACDIYLSPHVPNPDGTKFFGSPTKLFEYMAMGRPVVASALEQISEILEHDKTALLCEPGNVDDFVEKVSQLVPDKGKQKYLAGNALEVVKEKYTWDKNVEAVLARLEAVLKKQV